MIRIRGRTRIEPEIRQVSMSDVAFLLLVFFISTSVLDIETGIPMVLPGLESSALTLPRRDLLLIHGGSTGQATVDTIPVEIEAVAGIIRERLQSSPDLVVAVQTEPDAPFAITVAILDQVRQADARRVSLRQGRDAAAGER